MNWFIKSAWCAMSMPTTAAWRSIRWVFRSRRSFFPASSRRISSARSTAWWRKSKSELISDRELQKAKNQIEAAFVFAQDSIFGQAMKIGSYEAAGGWKQMEGYLDGIRKVTRDDIRRVARQYLKTDTRTVGTLIPTKAQ